MRYIILLLIITGCSAYDDLKALSYTKESCLKFQEEYNRVGVLQPTRKIKEKVAECKSVGAWADEAKNDK